MDKTKQKRNTSSFFGKVHEYLQSDFFDEEEKPAGSMRPPTLLGLSWKEIKRELIPLLVFSSLLWAPNFLNVSVVTYAVLLAIPIVFLMRKNLNVEHLLILFFVMAFLYLLQDEQLIAGLVHLVNLLSPFVLYTLEQAYYNLFVPPV